MHKPTTRRTLLAAIFLLIACGTLGAQTPPPVQDLRVEPNPTTIDVAAVLRGRFNFSHQFTQSSAVTRAGSIVTVEHVIATIPVGLPTPGEPFGIPLGVLPEGSYSVVYRARATDGFQFQVQTLPLVVLGGAGLAVPALLAPSVVLLVVITLGLGLWGFRAGRSAT